MNTKTKKVKGLENAKTFRIKAGTFINPKNTVPGTGFINISTYPTKVELDLEILGDYAYEYLNQISFNIGMPVEDLENLLFNYDVDAVKKKEELISELQKKKNSLEKELEARESSNTNTENTALKKYIDTIKDRLTHLENNNNIKAGTGPIIFRISIPFWRLAENSYCGDIYVSKEDFFKGVLIFNKTFGRFCVNILPEHRFLIEDYYNNFIKMLSNINMDDRAFFFACPEEGNRGYNIGHFCTVCLSNKVKKNKRKVFKAIDYYKNINKCKHKLIRQNIKSEYITTRNLKIKNQRRLNKEVI